MLVQVAETDMGKKRFNKFLSLAEGEVVLDEVQDEATIEQIEDTIVEESANVVETEVSTEPASTTPTQAEIKFAKSFTGHPTPVDHASIQLAQSCASKKLLANFGADGYARGSEWHIYCK